MEITKEDLMILCRFMNGNIVRTKGEETVLDEYRKIGWVRPRMKAIVEKDTAKIKVIPTASLTLLGKQFVKRERLLVRFRGGGFLCWLFNL